MTNFLSLAIELGDNFATQKSKLTLQRMEKTVQLVRSQYILLVLIGSLLLLKRVGGDPRAQTVNITCGNQLQYNKTICLPNFVATMEKISEQMRVSGFGTAITGSGPDTN